MNPRTVSLRKGRAIRRFELDKGTREAARVWFTFCPAEQAEVPLAAISINSFKRWDLRRTDMQQKNRVRHRYVSIDPRRNKKKTA